MGRILGKWITNQTAEPFYARKRFVVEKEVEKAEARVCGLGQFVFYINGQKVGGSRVRSRMDQLPENNPICNL